MELEILIDGCTVVGPYHYMIGKDLLEDGGVLQEVLLSFAELPKGSIARGQEGERLEGWGRQG